MSFAPMFTLPVVFNAVEKFTTEKKKKIAEGLSVFGEDYVNDARGRHTGEGGSYHDQTGNLRSSIGYSVSGGKSWFPGDKQEGRQAGIDLAKEVIANESRDVILLVGVAGMEYAAAVESKGYTVMTPFVPKFADIKSFLKDCGLIG